MFTPRPEVVFRMLRAVEACGADGARTSDFARRYYPGPVTPGQIGCAGRAFAHLMKMGLVLRAGAKGGKALHQLTDAGREFLATFWQKARQEAEIARSVSEPSREPAPSTRAADGYGEGW